MSRHSPAFLAVVAALTLLPLPTEAGAPTEELRAATEKVVRLLEDPALKPETRGAEREAAVLAAVVDLFDFTEISRRSLGRHWRGLGEGQRQEFAELFRALLERTYLPKIKLYQGQRVRFVGESVDGELATVQTKFVTRREQEIPVAFRLHLNGGRWLVYDVSVEGISLVSNYRAQFNQIIQRATFEGLLARLREKLAAGAPLEGVPIPLRRN